MAAVELFSRFQIDTARPDKVTTRREKLRAGAGKLLLVLGSVLVACLLAEVILRVTGYSYPIFDTTDYDRGYARLPGVEGWYWIENKNYVRINSQGFRDREHTKSKPADTIRIAVLGDSFAEAREVPLEETFWAVMERRLQECQASRNKRVEVLNFGVGGYGTAEELLTLRQRVWDYSPDVVLLTVATYNDVMDNYRVFKQAEDIPYFFYQNGRLVYDDSFRTSPKYRRHDSYLFKTWVTLHNHSRLLQLCHHAQFVIRTWLQERRATRPPAPPNPGPPPQPAQTSVQAAAGMGLHNMIYREPQDNDWNEAWRVTEGLIVQMRDEVRARGARFSVVTVSTGIQVLPNVELRKVFMQHLGVNNLFYPDLRLRALAEREGIEFLDLAPPMQAYADRNKVFLHGFGSSIGDGHWNPAGHRLAGELIAENLCLTMNKAE